VTVKTTKKLIIWGGGLNCHKTLFIIIGRLWWFESPLTFLNELISFMVTASK